MLIYLCTAVCLWLFHIMKCFLLALDVVHVLCQYFNAGETCKSLHQLFVLLWQLWVSFIVPTLDLNVLGDLVSTTSSKTNVTLDFLNNFLWNHILFWKFFTCRYLNAFSTNSKELSTSAIDWCYIALWNETCYCVCTFLT